MLSYSIGILFTPSLTKMCFNVEYLIFCKLYISVESGTGDTAAMEAAGDFSGAS